MRAGERQENGVGKEVGVRPIKEEIDELRGLNTAQLADRYRELFGRKPRVRHREFLWKRCAWRVQELRFGGLSVVAKRKLEELIAQIELPPAEDCRKVTGKLRGPAGPRALAVGTTLTREWHGRQVTVHVREDGFEHNGTLHRSLSAAVRAITNQRWRPALFFGLVTRKVAR